MGRRWEQTRRSKLNQPFRTDGSPLQAIPDYAHMNRAQPAPAPTQQTKAGVSGSYQPQTGGGRGQRPALSSVVWNFSPMDLRPQTRYNRF